MGEPHPLFPLLILPASRSSWVASDLPASVSFLWALAGLEGQVSGRVKAKASPGRPWPRVARRELRRVVARPSGSALSLTSGPGSTFSCVSPPARDIDCPRTGWVGPHLCCPQMRQCCPCKASPRPSPDPSASGPCLSLQRCCPDQSPDRLGGAQVWDEKGTALLHPYCMPSPYTSPTYNGRQCTLQMLPTHTSLGQGTQHQPWGKRLPEGHHEPKMSLPRERLKPSEQGLGAKMPESFCPSKSLLPLQPLYSPVYLL